VKNIFKIKWLSILSICVLTQNVSAQNGKYAGSLKKIIGHTYTDEKKVKGLESYEHMQGDLISDIADPNSMVLDTYVKKGASVVVFSQMSDTVTKTYNIIDVIEITNIQPGWEVKTADCQQGNTEGEILIALVKTASKAYLSNIKKAWRCNRDKIRFEAIKTIGIKCINEGFGE
jgi:hypothetical protein